MPDLRAQALRAYRRREYEAAFDLFRAAVEQDPTDTISLRGVAVAGWQVNDPDASLTAAKRLTELAPEDVRSWRAYGPACLRAGRADLALAAWERLSLMRPENPAHHYGLGMLHYEAGRFTQAGDALGKAVGLKPTYASAHYLLGLVHLALDDPSAAIERQRILRPLAPCLAEQLGRAIAPHRQGMLVTATIVVLTLWLGAGKWFVPQKFAQTWQIVGFALFALAFLAYRAYHRQAYPHGVSSPRHWEDKGRPPEEVPR